MDSRSLVEAFDRIIAYWGKGLDVIHNLLV